MTEEEVPCIFTSAPSQHLTCPVCQKLYVEPVINIGCGHTFCTQCAHSTSTCPSDGTTCDPGQMVVNKLVVGQIDDLLIYCRYGLTKEHDKYIPDPSGCQQKIPLGSRVAHESTCEFMPKSCSNYNCSATLRHSELLEHSKVCEFNTCSHQTKGCEFQGRKEEVVDHEVTCGYRGQQKNGEAQDRTMALEETNKDLMKQVTTLNMRLGQFEEANTALQGQLTDCQGNIKDLQQKYDNLSTLVDQLMSVRSRRSVGSPGHSVEGRPRSASQSSFRKSISGSPPVTARYEKWAMPFQFKCIGTLRGHQDVVWCMATRNKKLYTAGSDNVIKVWDLDSLQRGCIKTIQGHTNAIQCMAISRCMLYTGGHDNSIFCWSLEDYAMVHHIENAHDNIICSMAVVGDFLFTSSFSLIKVWEASTMVQKHMIPGLHHWVRALALNPDRDKLYSGSHNTIDIWSVTEPFTLKGKVDHQFGSVYSLAITSKYIIAGTYNRNVHLFNVSTYEHVGALKGHIGLVSDVLISHCGGFCISCSADNSIKIWNLENMLPIQTLQRHEGSVNKLVLHGDFLFSGSEDKEIKVFMYFQMQMGFAVNT